MSRAPARLAATLFGLGLLPVAPGTVGAAAGLLAAFGLWQAGGAGLLAVAAFLVSAAGLWASGVEAAAAGQADPGHIVIDEAAGQMLACLTLVLLQPTGEWAPWALAFVLFRLFDIVKPWPIGAAERLRPPALGIMADDWAAGLVAGLLAAAFIAR